MKLSLRYQELDCKRKKDPLWQDRVERWYQLDTAAYSLCEAGYQLQTKQWTRPDLIILSSGSGSNATDLEFARGGANSPSKFVHTLPNVRGSVLCQLLDWHGPVICLQDGNKTLISGLNEAISFLPNGEPSGRSCVWIFTIENENVICLEMLKIQDAPEGPESEFWIESNLKQVLLSGEIDSNLLNWLRNSSHENKSFGLTANHKIHRSQRKSF